MRRVLLALVPCVSFAALAAAQQGEGGQRPTGRRSLADGLVRQQVEVERLEPPRCEGGLEMAAGDGPLTLIVRRRDGRLEVHDIQRGAGDHGPAPEKVQMDLPAEVEELEKPAETPPERAAGKPPAREAAAAAKAPVERTSIRIVRKDGGLQVGRKGEPARLAAERLDRQALRAFLDECSGATKGTPFERELLLDAGHEVPFQDVLTVVEIARVAGFDAVFFEGAAAIKALPDEQQDLVLRLPERFGWKVERRGPGGVQPVCDGELLVLVDGPATWGEVAPIHLLCARAGIWRISYVARRDRTSHCKLPANLPFDRGL